MQQHPTTRAQAAPSKPFFRWVGGKTRLLPKLLPLLPPGGRLIEPFVGAGSVCLAATYPTYVLNDSNPDLVGAWAALQSRPTEFMSRAAELFVLANHSQPAYLRIRAEFNASTDRFERAVRLPYLNKFGFNGLFRVNRAGEYNVPYGWPVRLPTFPWDQLSAASVKLQRCTLLNGGFAVALDLAGPGDTVYCDPPYLDSSAGTSFTAYTAGSFAYPDHVALVTSARKAAARGAHVLISNHDTALTRELYRDWVVHAFSVHRSLSAKVSSRGAVGELLVHLFPDGANHTG